MTTSTHAFVTVDMRDLKAALVAHALRERVSVSVIVRRAVERELKLDGQHVDAAPAVATTARPAAPSNRMTKLSIRLTSAEAVQLATGAQRAGLSRGAFLAGLLSGIPSLTGKHASRPDVLAALIASTAELSTLSRTVHRLASVLRQGDEPVTLECREPLEALGARVRSHLRLAATALADVRTARIDRIAATPQRRATSQRKEENHARPT